MTPIILPTEKDVIEYLCNYLETKAKETLSTSNDFKVGLSGGSLINFLCKGLPEIKTEWSKWQFFFCDERVVPFDNADSTFRAYKEGLVGKIPVQTVQFVIINPALNVDEAADDYEKKLKSAFPDVELPSFDVLLLGVGPDGHTCSLFPGHSLLNETSRWIAPISDSPKPPPCRVTMTYPVLNNAKSCVFAMAGSGKAEIVNRLLKQNEDLPANRVKPTSGELIWILDQAAAASL